MHLLYRALNLLAWYSGKVIAWAQISDVPLICCVTLASYLAFLSSVSCLEKQGYGYPFQALYYQVNQ